MASEATRFQAKFLLFSLIPSSPAPILDAKSRSGGCSPAPTFRPRVCPSASPLRGLPAPGLAAARAAATEYTRANPNSVNLSAFYWQRAPRRQRPPRSCVCREVLSFGRALHGPAQEKSPAGAAKPQATYCSFLCFTYRVNEKLHDYRAIFV